MDANKTVTANFGINAYTISASSGSNGSITPSCPVSVNYGLDQTFTITPDAGYQVATLIVDEVSNPPAISYTFHNVTATHTIAVSFSLVSVTIGTANTPYNFDPNGDLTTEMTMVFSALPSSGGTVSVSLSPSFATPPENIAPPYLQITSTIPNHGFSATVSINVSLVPGFNSLTSHLMYYNPTTSSWVMMNGTYVAPFFTFTTDHFSTYAFINSSSAPTNVYVAASANARTACTVYPNTSWGSPTGYEGNPPIDWSWTGSQPATMYLVPDSGSVFSSANVSLEWDPAVLLFQGVDFGSNGNPNGLFGQGHEYTVTASYDQLLGTNRVTIHGARTDGNNFTISRGDYIASVSFTLRRPGHSAVAVIGVDLQQVSLPGSVLALPSQAEVKAYLGDVVSPSDPSIGDGKVGFNDLSAWSLSYWSGVAGFQGGLANYKMKYDLGPTQDGYIFSLPVPDTTINFEDLMIFAMSYGFTAHFQYPKVIAQPSEPTQVLLGQPVVAGNETRVPVMIGGSVADVRGMKLVINGQFGSFLGAEKGTLLQQYTTPVLLMSRAQGRNVYVDFAVVGLDADGIMRGGDVVWLRFAGDCHVRLNSVEGRASNNHAVNIAKAVGAGESVPATYNLLQNYPNPFNPTTTIEYEIPVAGDVSIEVYNILGAKVSTLFNGVQEAGFYQVQWNGRDDSNTPVATGVYLYRIRSGQFSSVKKMLFLK